MRSIATCSGPRSCRLATAGCIVSERCNSTCMVARLPVLPGGSDLCFVWSGPIAAAQAHLERNAVATEVGPVARRGARGDGISVYFRDPDGSLLELISYADA